jgi:hypothetical protein
MAALDVIVELWIDDAWVDITSDVYTRAPITITRGRSAEGGQVEPSTCTLTVNNRDGTYTPRNPAGDYYRKIGRNTPARVSVGADTRLVGEVASWPTRWDAPGKDVYAPLEVAGITRRLGQGNAPAPSAPRRYLPTTSPAAYWPLEDGPQTIQARLEAGAGSGMRLPRGGTSPQVWGQGKLADWLPPAARPNEELAGVFTADVAMSGFTDTWTVEMIRSGGSSDPPTVGGTLMSAVWNEGGAGDPDVYTILRFDQDSSEVAIDIGFSTLATAAVDASLWDDNPHHVRLTATQDGSAIDYQVWIDGALVLSTTDASETLGPVHLVAVTVSTTVSVPLVFGHMAVWTDPPALADSVSAAFGHTGEAAGRRIERLCDEQGIPFVAVGDLDDTAPMGPQAPRPPLELLQEAADTDHGILYESRDALGLEYRTRTDLYNGTPDLTADYSAKVFHGLPEPVDDDRFTRNDVTAKRPNSGEGRAVLESGALSTADPPDGVGTYDTSVTVNAAGDGFLADHAGWLLGLGTVDEARYPRLPFRLNAVPGIAADIAALDLGAMVRITDLPSWLPPDDVDVLVVGTIETLESHMRDIELVTAPAAPYRVGIYGDTVGDDPSKYDTAGTIRPLDFSAITTTQTAITFETLIGPPWTQDDDEFPFDIYVGGERMTVTDITGTGGGPLEQSFTVTRSVNGVVKGHDPGTPVRLWNPARYGL